MRLNIIQKYVLYKNIDISFIPPAFDRFTQSNHGEVDRGHPFRLNWKSRMGGKSSFTNFLT